MRWLLAVVVSVGCSGATPSSADGGGAPAAATPGAPAKAGSRTEIKVQELAALKGAQIVDVRTDEEWAAGHVPGAIHVPLADLKPEHPAIAGLNREQPIHFICAVGGRSAKATDAMAAKGFQAVNVTGGTNAWIDSGLPIEKPGRPL